MPLSAARRVVLLSYNPVTRTIDFRHYLISIRPVGVSRSVRKIIDGTSGRRRAARETSVYSAAPSDQSGSTRASFAALRAKGLPDLRNAQDISDYILNHGEMGFLSSASEGESDASGGEEDPVTGENSKQIELAHAYVGRANKRLGHSTGGEKRAVRLTELGPRMELGLVKIEDGIGDGKGEVLFHEFIHKTPKEAAAIARKAKEKEKLAKSRRAEQEANVKRKKEEKEALKKEKADKKKAKIASGETVDEEEEEEESESEDEFAYEDMFGNEEAPAGDEEDVDGGEEVFEENSEDEDLEKGDEEDDDSDLSPIPYNESSDGDSASEDEEGPPARAAKKAKTSSGGPRGDAGRGQSSFSSRGKPSTGGRGRGRGRPSGRR